MADRHRWPQGLLQQPDHGGRLTVKRWKPGRLRAALQQWLGVPIGLAERAFWREWFSTSSSGNAVSVDSAMRLDSIFGASLSAEEAAAKVFAKRPMSLLVV